MRWIKYRVWYKRFPQPINGELRYFNQAEENFPAMCRRYQTDDWMQFIGIEDKNGKEIYDGDVVRNVDGIAIVKYDEIIGSFVMEHKEAKITFPHYFFSEPKQQKDTIEVIGNIYENKEYAW